LIQTGYQAAQQHSSELMQYHLNDADWDAYLAARNSRTLPSPGILRQVKVEGGTGEARAAATRGVESLDGRPIDTKEINKALWKVGGSGSYGAWYETFSDGPAKTADATTVPDTGVLIHLREARTGRPFLMLGADVTATTSNVTRNTIDFRYVHRDLGGFGSELRADVRVGFLTQLSTEYYRRLTTSGLFLQPHLGIIRQPVYSWSDQKRVSERFEQLAGGGLDFGRTFNRNAQLSAEWRMQTVRWDLTLGKDDSTNTSGTYFRRDVADPLRFTLGGPLRLSASSIDEYRGTDAFLIRSGYETQIKRS
jgi:NTE family protein